MASVLTSYLPPFDGLLPKWLILVSLISIGNSAQAYLTLHYTQRVYNGPASSSRLPLAKASPVTPLSARTFGTWTVLASILRLYAAYHIDEPAFYQLAIWSYLVAFAHFGSEWMVFKTTRWGAGLAGPVIVASLSVGWMWMQWDYYVKY